MKSDREKSIVVRVEWEDKLHCTIGLLTIEYALRKWFREESLTVTELPQEPRIAELEKK